jgi:hypothetical protein
VNRPTEPANGQHLRNGDAGPQQYMEIGGVGVRRRLWGWALYLMLFAGVSALLIFVFLQFTGSMRLAVALVLFMVTYMAFMGWWASRNDENLDTRRGDQMQDEGSLEGNADPRDQPRP